MKHTVSEVVLKSGARGLLIDVPGATVMSYQFHFRAGDSFVRDKSIYETAHLMEHMAFGANSKFKDGQAFGAEFSRNGAFYNAFTSRFGMGYVADCADFEWQRILELLQLAITTPRFNEEELVGESGNVKSELTGYLNVPGRILWTRLAQALGEDILTYRQRLETIKQIKLADVKDHYKRTHTLANLRFVIAGNLHGRVTKITELLESWELLEGERMLIPVDELHSAPPILIKRKEHSNLTFGWTMSVPRRLSDEEIDAMGCLNHIFAGTLHSRILGAARKKGLAYSMFCETAANEHNSSWDFGAEVNLDNLDAFFDIMAGEVKLALSGTISDADVDSAKSFALGKHQMDCQTVRSINSWYADSYFFDGHIENFDDAPAAIKSVTKTQIVSVANQFIDANCWIFGGIGSAEKEIVNHLNQKLAKLFS